MELAAAIAQIMNAASGTIAHIVGLVSEGKHEEAKLVVKRFVALSEAELQSDRDKAEEVLKDRFG